MTLNILRGLFILLTVGVAYSVLSEARGLPPLFRDNPWIFVIFALVLAVTTIAVDFVPDRRKFTIFSGVAFGLVVGLVLSYGLSFVITLLVDNVLLPETSQTDMNQTVANYFSYVLGCLLCYISIAFVLQTRDDFRFIVPYVEFRRDSRGAKPYVVDTSVLVDGRIAQVATTGIFESPLIVPQFVVAELQALADSADKNKRGKGRRGLEVLAGMKQQAGVDVRIYEPHTPADLAAADMPVDQRLLELARQLEAKAVTIDFNLNRVSQVTDVPVLNLHDLASSLQMKVMPGDSLQVEIARTGKGEDQGIGYLEDGTMVVVEVAGREVGRTVEAVVTNTTQSSAGRMVFARAVGKTSDAASDSAADIAPPKQSRSRRKRVSIAAGEQQ